MISVRVGRGSGVSEFCVALCWVQFSEGRVGVGLDELGSEWNRVLVGSNRFSVDLSRNKSTITRTCIGSNRLQMNLGRLKLLSKRFGSAQADNGWVTLSWL